MSKINNFLSIAGKIALVILVINLGISYSLWLFNPPAYAYKEYNFFIEQATIFSQPTMDLLANSKVTHGFHFKNIEFGSIDSNIEPLQIRSNYAQIRSFEAGLESTIKNAYVDLRGSDQAAIIEPINFQGQWSLVFCEGNDNTNCQESLLLHKNKIKILVDGHQKVWGKSIDNKFIQLNLVKYLPRSQEAKVLFV